VNLRVEDLAGVYREKKGGKSVRVAVAPEVWPAPPRRSAESHRIRACTEQQNFKRALKKPPVSQERH